MEGSCSSRLASRVSPEYCCVVTNEIAYGLVNSAQHFTSKVLTARRLRGKLHVWCLSLLGRFEVFLDSPIFLQLVCYRFQHVVCFVCVSLSRK